MQRTATWSVKIQRAGKRRTFALGAVSRMEAATSAERIYRELCVNGWSSQEIKGATNLLPPPEGLPSVRPPASPNDRPVSRRVREKGPTPEDLDYWRGRLIHRKYLEPSRSGAMQEYCVRIEHDGAYSCFPLASRDEFQAATRAQDIHRTVRREGWPRANEMFSREFTVAIFWSNNPVACSYTTVLSFAQDKISRPLAPPKSPTTAVPVLLVEPEISVRESLMYWLDRQEGFRCPRAFASARDLFEERPSVPQGMILFNRSGLDLTAARFVEAVHQALPQLPLFGYGIYEDSDQIFIRLTGVTGGYIFRRRAPLDLLEPVRGTLDEAGFTRRTVTRRIRDYFQRLFGISSITEDQADTAGLTVREQEVLRNLSKGFVDKEIAESLRISVWTVHNHLKRIYEKLGVRTRTEAVVKYLNM